MRIVFLLFVTCLAASAAEWPVENMRRLQKAALESDYALRQTAYLANNIGPRLTGSRQAAAAVEYVADEMRRQGMTVRLEELRVPHWERGRETGALVGYPGQVPGTVQQVALTALGNSVPTPDEGLTAEVLVVDSMEALEGVPEGEVAGKIVLFNQAYDEEMAEVGHGGAAYGEAVEARVYGPSAAARKGAAAALVRSAGGGAYRMPHTGVTVYAEDAPRIPAGAVALEDADLIAYLAGQGPVRMHLVLTPRWHPDALSHNVIADLPGTEDPEEVVVVSGHLDSWDLGTGALDDASGVAMAMATVKLVRDLGLTPRRTIRMVAFMNEENGGVGAKTYAANHDASRHFGAIESDLGAGHPVGLYVTGKPELVDVLKPVGQVLSASGAGILRHSPHTGADISPLARAGVPCFHPLQDSRSYFTYHHTAADTFDKVNPRWLAENTAVMAVLAYALADYPGELPRE